MWRFFFYLWQFFSGTFDGDGHTLSNLHPRPYRNYQGLVGYADKATIKNVNITDKVKTKKEARLGM